MVRAIIRTVVGNTITSGGPKQNFTISGIGTPKAAAIYVTSKVTAFGVDNEKKLSVGFTDGTSQVGVAAQDQDGVATVEANTVLFDDSVVQLPNDDGTGLVAKAIFDSFITDGIRLEWTTIPDAAYRIMVVLWAGDDIEVKVGNDRPTTTVGENVKVVTGFEPDHIMTAARTTAPFNETFERPWTMSLAHVINLASSPEGGSGAKVRGYCHRQVDGNSTSVPVTVLNDDDLASIWTSNSLPLTFSRGTKLDDTTPFENDGFNIESSAGAGSARGPRIAYLAVNYGGKRVTLDDYVTPTSNGTEFIELGMRPDSWLGFQTSFLASDKSWGPREGDDGNGASVGGPVAGNETSFEWSISLQADDGVGTMDTSSRVQGITFHITNSSPVFINTYRAQLDSIDDSGVTFDWLNTPSSGNGRLVSLFFLETEDMVGSAALRFPKLEMEAVGVHPFIGTSELTLPAVELDASGTLQLIGSSVLSLPIVDLASDGLEILPGTSALTLPAADLLGAGLETLAGSSVLDLPSTEMASAGVLSLIGSSVLVMPAAESNAVGLEIFTGSSVLDLPAMPMVAVGTTVDPSVTGTAVLVMQAADLSAAGLEIFTGSSANVMAPANLEAAGIETLEGTSALALPPLGSSSLGAETFVGSMAATLPATLALATGAESFVGTAALVLAPADLASAGITLFGDGLVCDVDLLASWDQTAILAGGFSSRAILTAGFSSKAALEASFDAAISLSGSYDGRAVLAGSVCL